MMWIVLAASGVLEAVWASALPATRGFRKPLPTLVFAVAAVLSMVGLSFAMTQIPVGTAYSVWVGIGALLTLCYSVIRGREQLTLLGALFMACLLGSVVGLKVVS
jgi:quaternary ammonium compound-resistance protein SugE